MPDTYHIRIKKSYAAAVIEDLQKMDAVEFIADNSTDIPDWQMELGKKELQNIASGNTELLTWMKLKSNSSFNFFMPYTIITTTSARRDIQQAIDWENMRNPDLGEYFLNDF